MMYGRGVAKPSFRERTAYHAMLLGGMAMITSALIVIADKQTRQDIALRRAEDTKYSLSQVIHPDMHTNDLLKDVKTLKINGQPKKFYRARSADKIIAVAYQMSGQGYAGPIEVMLGVNKKGKLLGVRILSHVETPGLGDKVEPEKSDWVFKFSGLSLHNPGEQQWKVKKDGGYFDQFTGATITPRAVITTVKQGLELFNKHQAEILHDAPSPDKTHPPETPELKQTTNAQGGQSHA
jgi:electron transport complex protein RnfG